MAYQNQMQTTQTDKLSVFRSVLNDTTLRAQVKNSLKENAGAFMSSMIDLYSGDSQLQKCNPQAVAAECLKAASLNLPLVKSIGMAYVVAYGGQPTFVIGYKGLIQLAQRTGLYQHLNADCVYEGEELTFDRLSGDITLAGEKTSDTAVGYFAYFKLNNGFEKTFYMTKEEVETYARRYSKSFNSNYSPWKTEFDKMAQKTCLRQLIGKYGPMSIEMADAIAKDNDYSEKPVRSEQPVSVDVVAEVPAPAEPLEAAAPAEPAAVDAAPSSARPAPF